MKKLILPVFDIEFIPQSPNISINIKPMASIDYEKELQLTNIKAKFLKNFDTFGDMVRWLLGRTPS